MYKALFLGCLFALLPLMLGCESLDPTRSQFAPADSEIYILRGHKGGVNSVVFGPYGETLASGDSEGTIQLWHIPTRRHLKTVKGHKGSINSLSINPVMQMLASGSSDGTIRLWHQYTGRHLTTLEGHEGSINSVSFDPTGHILASASTDGTIRIWDTFGTLGSEHLKTLKGHVLSVNSIDFHPTEPILASGSDDETIRLWNPQTGEHLKTIDVLDYSQRFTYSDPDRVDVLKVMFSPDGQILASATFARMGPRTKRIEAGLSKFNDPPTTIRLLLWRNWAANSEPKLESSFPRISPKFTFSRDGQMIVTIGINVTTNRVRFLDLEKIRYWYRDRDDKWYRYRDDTTYPYIKSLSTIAEQYKDWDKVRKLNKKDQRTIRQLRSAQQSIAISPDGQMIALGLTSHDTRVDSQETVVLLWTAFSLE